MWHPNRSRLRARNHRRWSSLRFLFVWWVAMAAWAADGYVTSSGSGFVLNGQSYHAAGTNCYYLTYKSPAMVDAAP